MKIFNLLILLTLSSCSLVIPDRDYSLESERSLKRACLAKGKIVEDITDRGSVICVEEEE